MTLPDINLSRRHYRSALKSIDEWAEAVATELGTVGGGAELPAWTGLGGAEFQIGTWPGGLRVMRKVVDIGNLPNNTTKTVPHGVADMVTLLDIAGIVSVGGGVFTAWGQPNITGITIGALVWVSPGDSIRVVTTADLSAYTGFIILTYTKA